LRAQEEERKRISRELHDEAGQGLMVLRLYLGMLASESATRESTAKIQEAMAMLDRTIGDLRRIIARLSPRILDEMGLLSAIRKEARELSRTSGMKSHMLLPERLEGISHEVEVAVYRSVQEALNNIAKHSQARNFRVCLERLNSSLELLVEDDGIGFRRTSRNGHRSFGIVGMRERIAALGGTVRVRSRARRGTRVKVSLPLRSAGMRKHAGDSKVQPIRIDARRRSPKRPAREVPVRPPVKPSNAYTNVDQVFSR
jgi:signal transduction histidine kinase